MVAPATALDALLELADGLLDPRRARGLERLCLEQVRRRTLGRRSARKRREEQQEQQDDEGEEGEEEGGGGRREEWKALRKAMRKDYCDSYNIDQDRYINEKKL